MIRLKALAVVAAAAILLTGCSRTEPVEVPVPEWVDLEAAAEIGSDGNGLWLLDGPSAASEIIDAMRAQGSGSMAATVQEMIPQEEGAPLTGRSISVSTRTDGVNVRAELTVGNQRGDLIVIGQEVWVRGNQAFADTIGVEDAGVDAEAFVCVPRGSTTITDLLTLATPAEFLRTTLMGLEMGVLAPDGENLETQKLVLGSGGAPTGDVSVSAIGAPLPHTLYVSDQSGDVRAEFTWDAPEEIVAPEGDASRCQ